MGYSASLRVFGAEDASLFEALLGLGTEFLSCVVGTVVIVSLVHTLLLQMISIPLLLV